MENDKKLPPLEDGLLRAMLAIEKQIEREMQRTPAEREKKGVVKWEPYQTRVEKISSFILDSIGDEEANLDSLIVLSQSFTKALKMFVEDLGEQGLGKVRAQYCLSTFQNLARDAEAGMDVVSVSKEDSETVC